MVKKISTSTLVKLDISIDKRKHKTKHLQKFRPKWLTLFKWLQIDPISKKPLCTICNKLISNNITHIKRHEETRLHKKFLFGFKCESHSIKTKSNRVNNGNANLLKYESDISKLLDDQDTSILEQKKGLCNPVLKFSIAEKLHKPREKNLVESNSIKYKKKYNQKFILKWLENFKWMEMDLNTKRPLCKICNKLISNNITHIQRHEKSNYHQKKIILTKSTLENNTTKVFNKVTKESNEIVIKSIDQTASKRMKDKPVINLLDLIPEDEDSSSFTQHTEDVNISAEHSYCIEETQDEMPSESELQVSEKIQNKIPMKQNIIQKKKKYNQRFCTVWLKEYKWILRDPHSNRPFCRLCKKLITNNICNIRRHEQSKFHQKILNESNVIEQSEELNLNEQNDGGGHFIVENNTLEKVGNSTNNFTVIETQNNINTALKKKFYNQRFRTKWLQRFQWIEVDEELKKPFCKLCKKSISNNICHIQRHEESRFHQSRSKDIPTKIPEMLSETDKMRVAKRKTILCLIQNMLPLTLINDIHFRFDES